MRLSPILLLPLVLNLLATNAFGAKPAAALVSLETKSCSVICRPITMGSDSCSAVCDVRQTPVCTTTGPGRGCIAQCYCKGGPKL